MLRMSLTVHRHLVPKGSLIESLQLLANRSRNYVIKSRAQPLRCFALAAQDATESSRGSPDDVRQGSIVGTKMQAWQSHQYGGIDQLRLSHATRVPPLENPYDVLVAVHAASVNPIDVDMLGRSNSCYHSIQYLYFNTVISNSPMFPARA